MICRTFLFWTRGVTLLTLYEDSVDEPGDLRFGLSADPTGQAAGLIGGEDQVPGSADPERSRCGREKRKKPRRDMAFILH